MSHPIIIGGNGGSGTRVFAEILQRSGIFVGHDLHDSNMDDQLFVWLFKRVQLLSRGGLRMADDKQALFGLHERLFFGRQPESASDRAMLRAASRDHLLDRWPWAWLRQRRHRLRHARPAPPQPWGFKEPNSHLFIEPLHRHYPESKFVLVMRNGFDMAYSKNHQQLGRWGAHFGLDPRDLGPANRFEYWYHSNKRALDLGRRAYGDRFLAIKLEDLCLEKETALRAYLNFADLDSQDVSQEIWDLPKLPRTSGRYKHHDGAWITPEVERKAAELGYER